MNKKNKITTIITAGGKSERFGSNKLLEKIGNLSVIEMTVSKFLDLSDEIIIPCLDVIKNHIENSKLYSNKIKFAPSGKTRQISVYNALQTCINTDIILIHDGARPFIEKETIKKAIELTEKHHAVLVGIKAIDTIKEIKDDKIIKTLDRNNIFQAQTPQCFKFDLIKKVHELYKDNPNFTDDCSMVEEYGKTVHILEGSKKNIKITTKEDLP